MLKKKIWILSLIVISGLYAENNTTVKTDTNTTVVENNSSTETNTTTSHISKPKTKTKTKHEKKDYSGVEAKRDIGSLQDIKNQLQTTPSNIEKSKYNFVGDR